jgi:excisionase family DNA binding protein
MNTIAVTTIGVQELKEIIESTIESKLSIYLKQESQLTLDDSEQELITRNEVAKKLRISLPTLSTLTKSGTIKGYRIGRRVLYKWSEVKNALPEIGYFKYKRKDLK